MALPILELSKVAKHHCEYETRIDILTDVDLVLVPSQTVALVAPSGAGKSTLLQIAGLLERPTAGEVRIENRPTSSMSDDERTRLRRDVIGFVYQFHHLLPEFSALENIMLPLRIRGIDRREATKRALLLLDHLQLGNRASHRPSELSGGERQRVAIARAWANEPRVLLADEPTGNLDPFTAESVFATFRTMVQSTRLAALIATHNIELARQMDRRLTLREGRIVELA